MTDVLLGVAAYSAQSAKPSTKFGQLALLPLFQSQKNVETQFSLAGIPAGATILSAILNFKQGVAVTGTHSMSVFRLTSPLVSSITWDTLPTRAASATVTVSKSSPAAGTVWGFDITALVQTFVTGTNKNLGLAIAKNEASLITLLGTTAAANKPNLAITYTLAPSTPSNLHPSSGAVSIAKPTVTFDTDDDVVSIQVQIDPSSNPTTPAFDSLEVAATAGLLDLTLATPGGTYAGLSNAATTTWRARQKNASGWSPWSSWATFSRTNKSAVTITSPSTGAITDGTPPTTWTFGGTQRSWQARLLNATGAVLADSGHVNGTAASWTPAKGLVTNGQTGTLEVRVWDAVDRESTPGDAAYAIATLAVTLTLSGAVTPVTTLVVGQTNESPVVQLTGTRASIPDEVRVFVNGAQVASYVGTAVFSGANYTIPDVSAPMNLLASYRVAAVVNGVVASGGPVVAYTPRCTGIWLIDEADHSACVPVITAEKQGQTQPEFAIVHTPLTPDEDGTVQAVRRRLVSYPPQGDVLGTVLDAIGFSVVSSEAFLRAWKEYDAGHLFRLVLGNLNRTVIIGDLTFTELPESGVDRLVDVAFNWWSQK